LLSPEFTVSVVVSQISFEETFDDCFSEIDWDKIDTDEDDWDAELKDIAFNYAGLFDNAAFPFQQAVPFNKLELLPKESRRELRTYVCEVSFVFVSAFVWVCFFLLFISLKLLLCPAPYQGVAEAGHHEGNRKRERLQRVPPKGDLGGRADPLQRRTWNLAERLVTHSSPPNLQSLFSLVVLTPEYKPLNQ